MAPVIVAEAANGTTYSLDLLTAAQYIAQQKERGTWTMSNYDAEEMQDDRHDALARFNSSNVMDLDAQPTYRDPEGVTVYVERAAGPYEVAEFDTVTDFQNWAAYLDGLYEDDALDTIERLQEAHVEAEGRRHAGVYVAAVSLDDDLAYDRGDYKAERSAA